MFVHVYDVREIMSRENFSFLLACRWITGVFNKYVGVGRGRGLGCILLCINKSITDSSIVGAMHNLDPACFCLQRGGKYIGHRRYRSCFFK